MFGIFKKRMMGKMVACTQKIQIDLEGRILETMDFGPLMIAPTLTKCNSHFFLVYYHFLVRLVAQWNGIYRQQTGKKNMKREEQRVR